MEINKDLKIENTNTKLEDLSCSVLPSGTNLNNCKTTGIFYCDSGNSYENLPEGANGWLVVLKAPNNANYCKQLWFRHGTANANGFHSFTRELHGTTWSNWDRFVAASETGVFLPISGGTLTGKLKLSNSGMDCSNSGGGYFDQYMNLHHKIYNTGNYWRIRGLESDGTTLNDAFRFYYDTGNMNVLGNIGMGNTSRNEDTRIDMKTNSANGTLMARPNGNLGLYDNVHSKWVILCNSEGEVQVEGFYIYFHSGDTFTMGKGSFGGVITGSTQSIIFSVPVNRSLKNISSITVNGGNFILRGISGYLNNETGGINYNTSGYTFTAEKEGDKTVMITIKKSSAFTNVTNNTPVSVYLSNLSLSFS